MTTVDYSTTPAGRRSPQARRYRITADDVLPALLPHVEQWADELSALIEYELWRVQFDAGNALLDGKAIYELPKTSAAREYSTRRRELAGKRRKGAGNV